MGVNEKNDIVKYIEMYSKKIENHIRNTQIENSKVSKIEEQKEFLDFGTITDTEKTRAVVKVQDGCNQFCSYCIIPYARGRIRSRKPQSVLQEIKKIGEKKIKEVVITGIHVASYGKDFEKDTIREIKKWRQEKKLIKPEERKEDEVEQEENYQLIDLLEDIQNIPEIERIRLGSLEPTLITKEFVQRLSKLSKICDQFHLSLQSGCDETLKRMNRKYTIQQFEEGVKLLRDVFPQVHLTTDIIVGFPRRNTRRI